MKDIRLIIHQVEQILKAHELGRPGEYAQWTKKEGRGDLNSPATPYGCAIAVNILYTLRALPTDQAVREQMIRVLQSFQDPETGYFVNPGNYETHTTAFLSGALEVLGAEPLYRVKALEEALSEEGLTDFMEKQIDWKKAPWLGAHLGSGIYGSMVLTKTADLAWEDLYFKWLDDNQDPETGLWKKGDLDEAPLAHHIASSFHYVFNYEYARRAMPYPQALLDTCIEAYRTGACIDFAKEMGWLDIDFTYTLAHAQRRAGTRFEETQAILKEIADGLIGQLEAMTEKTQEFLDNTNNVFAIVSALALLQEFLPGYIRTERPLQLVIDRRPFL